MVADNNNEASMAETYDILATPLINQLTMESPSLAAGHGGL